MDDLDPHALDRQLSISAAVMLMLGPDGLQIPGLDDAIGGQVKHAALPTALPELILLNRLARRRESLRGTVDGVAARTGSDPGRLVEFVTKLSVRGLLVETDPGRATPLGPASPESVRAHAADDGGSAVIPTPTFFRLSRRGFEHVDRHGHTVLVLSPVDLAAASEFRQPATTQEALAAHRAACGSMALPEAEFAAIVTALRAAGLLRQAEPVGIAPVGRAHVEVTTSRRGRPLAPMPAGAFTRTLVRDRFHGLNDLMRDNARACEAAEEERESRTGRTRVKVVNVQQNGTILPLAVGMITAAARSYDNGRLNEDYLFHPDWLVRPAKVRALTARPGVFLFSNYAWSHSHNLSVSRKVKQLSPWSVTVHGGPNTPKYEADCVRYFRANPDVDITVRGEGEETVCDLLAALAGQVGDRRPDLSVLHDVSGISFRDGDDVVRTPDRPRIADLDSLPSPFLDGLFEPYAGKTDLAIIESNRGCPYSCAFCDWGSAINTRIRKFSLDRVFAELEWCARHQVEGVMIADANFGIFARDVEIAEKVAQLKEEYGYPYSFSTNFAKNTTAHLRRIIEVLSDVGVISTSTMAVQSMDAATLKTIRRSNIKLREYDRLATEFRKAELPLSVDLMYGLPGQTFATFQDDLQGCVNRGLFPRMYMTELLVNSPMNERQYRAENDIVTEPSADGSRHFVVSSTTFTRRDYEEMNSLRRHFALFEIFGMLREVAHYVRGEQGIREIDFYDRLRRDLRDDPERWPTLAFSARALPSILAAPGAWQLVIDEVGAYLTDVCALQENDALRTVLAVQLAVLPTPDHDPAPLPISLPHDYASWHKAMVAARDSGHQNDWHAVVPPLRTYGPARFDAADQHDIGDFGIGLALYGVQPETSVTVRPRESVNRM